MIKYRNLQWRPDATDPTLEPTDRYDLEAENWGEIVDPQKRRADLDQYLAISGKVWQVSYDLILVTEETEDGEL